MRMQYLKNVVSLALEAKKCVGCGRCVEVCPRDVLAQPDGKAVLAHKDQCIECGACARNCPAAAIAVSPGVGCAAAIIESFFTGEKPVCDCSGGACC
jgi:NAD-dependent dihydropyrimidine dehydrogenase PreA subunit